MERLSATLRLLEAPKASPSGAAAPEASSAPAGEAPAAALPTAAEMVKAASQLEALVKDDDIACVHFRQCGGLRGAADQVRCTGIAALPYLFTRLPGSHQVIQ